MNSRLVTMDSYHCLLQIPVSWIPEVLVVRKVIHSFNQTINIIECMAMFWTLGHSSPVLLEPSPFRQKTTDKRQI